MTLSSHVPWTREPWPLFPFAIVDSTPSHAPYAFFTCFLGPIKGVKTPGASTMSSNRFCFYHCLPPSGGSASPLQAAKKNQDVEALQNGGSLIDATCISVPAEQLAEAKALNDQRFWL